MNHPVLPIPRVTAELAIPWRAQEGVAGGVLNAIAAYW
jgi:hypothetical protein